MPATNDLIVSMQSSVSDLHKSVGRLEGKVDTFIEQMKAQDNRTIAHDVRLGKLENRQYWWAGVAAAFGAVVGKFVPAWMISHGS